MQLNCCTARLIRTAAGIGVGVGPGFGTQAASHFTFDMKLDHSDETEIF